MEDSQFAVLVITHKPDNSYDERQLEVAKEIIAEGSGFLAVADGIYLINLKQAFPTLAQLYSRESRHQEFRLRFAVIPCGPNVFGAFRAIEAKAMVGFGLTHWETPIPAAQERR